MTHTSITRAVLVVVAVAPAIALSSACSSSTAPPSGSSSATATSGSASASTTSSATAQAAATDAAYCTALESGQKELASMSSRLSDKAAPEQGRAVLEKIDAAAPAEVKQAWGDFIAFVDAAVSGDKGAVAAATSKMEAASTKIEQHAKATCNLDVS